MRRTQHHSETMNLAGAIVISAPIWGAIISTTVKRVIRRKKVRKP